MATTSSGASGWMQTVAVTLPAPLPSDEEQRAADLEALAQQANRMLATRRPVQRATMGAAGEDRAADLEALAMQVNRMLERKRPVASVGGDDARTGMQRRTGWRKLWAR